MAFACTHALRQVLAILRPESVASRLLKERGHKKYHMEYQGFLSNHLAHGILALQGLGATGEQIRSWADRYCTQLEPPQAPVSKDAIDDVIWEAYLGQRRDYTLLVAFFQEQVRTSLFQTKRSVIGKYADRLMEGLVGGAFHGLIHLGFGIHHYEESTQTNLLAEGLAYFAFEYKSLGPVVPTHTSESLSNLNLIEVLESMREEPRFAQVIKDNMNLPEYTHLGGGFQNKVFALADHGGDLLQSFLERSAIYRELADSSDKDKDKDKDKKEIDTDELARNIFRCVVLDIYAQTEGRHVNDFFLLHGVTSCWALRKVLPYLPSDESRRMALLFFIKALLAAYAAQGMPLLKEPEDEEVLTSAIPPLGGTARAREEPMTWEMLADAACSDPELDEHFIKLVYVCREEARGPDVNPPLDVALRKAASIPLLHPYRFGSD